MKFNNNASAKEMKKQTPKEIVHKIDMYFIKNNITTIKLCTVRILSNRDITIQTTSIEEAKKLRKEDNQTEILRNKAKLTQKQYKVVTFEISMAKIDFEKMEETKEKLVT